jgi:hypothetical protein
MLYLGYFTAFSAVLALPVMAVRALEARQQRILETVTKNIR